MSSAIKRAVVFTPARITAASDGTGFDTQKTDPADLVLNAFGFFIAATVVTLRVEHSIDNVTFTTHPSSPGGASGFAATAAGTHVYLPRRLNNRYVRLSVITFTGTDAVVGGELLWPD